MREIAAVIGRRLNLPVLAKSPADAAEHFGWFAPLAQVDAPASSAKTQQILGGARLGRDSLPTSIATRTSRPEEPRDRTIPGRWSDVAAAILRSLH
jgi:hypothetical protein